MPMIPAWGISLLIAGGGTGLQLLFAPRPPKQAPVDLGKFDDVRVQGADYGAFIPRGWGTYRVAGNLIFSNGIQHYVIDEPTTGGKGGVPQAPATRRHVYQSSIGVLVARGPVDRFVTLWADADIVVGGGHGPINPRELFEAEDATLAGTATVETTGTFSGTGWVSGIGGTGVVTFDFTSMTPPANPYDPSEAATPRTYIEIGYKSLVTRTAVVTTDDGSGPVATTITLEPTESGDWSLYPHIINGFTETCEYTYSSTTASIDYVYVTYFWQPGPGSTSVPFRDFKPSGVVNPDIVYPPYLDDPAPYYNYDPELTKDATTGIYQMTTSVPGDSWRWYTGTETQTQDSAISEWLDDRYGTGQGALRTSAMRGLVYLVIANYTLRQGRVPNFTFEMYTGAEDVNDILEDLCADVGIASTDYDFSATTGLTQTGFLETSSGSRAALFDQLQKYHLFRRAEIDGKIKTVLHSFTSVYTVDVDSMRAHSSDEEMPAFDAQVVCAEEHLLPREVRVSIMNPTRDYHNETAVAQLFTVPGTESRDYNFNIIDSLSNARLQAEKLLLKEHAESQAVEFWAMPELARYSVGDVITVPINGLATNIRIEKKQMTLPIGKIRIQGVTVNPFTPTAYQSNTTTTVSLPRGAVAAYNYPRNSIVVPIQSIPIREADKGKLGLYLAPCGRGFGYGENIALYREFDTDNYVLQFVSDTPAQAGLTAAKLDDHGDPTTEDVTNTLDIWFFDSVSLESVTAPDIARYPNLNLLRVGDEWVQFRTAVAATLEDNSPYRSKWTVSNFMRGRFGTEAFLATHAAGEYAVVASHALKFYELEQEDIGQVITLKAVTGGQAIDNAPISTFTFSPPFDADNFGSLFNHYTDDTTAGTTQENFYTYTLPAGSLSNNGDKLRVEYSGIFTGNGNTKRVYPKFAGTVLATGQTSSASATDWTIDYYIVRVSNSVVRFAVEITASDAVLAVESGEITGLDLAATDYLIDLDGRSVTAAGEVTAKSGYGVFIPAS